MNHNLAVRVRNLNKSFKGKDVIKNCNMSVSCGTIYGFLGANGAGKTTIFKLLAGLQTPTLGELQIFGKEYSFNRSEIARNIGTLIGTPVFYEDLSAKKNLEIHLAYMESKIDEIQSVLDMVGLFKTGNQAVSEFSLGMRQRLAIARAISHKPRLLILDESINGLDPMGLRDMRILFSHLVKNYNMTIIISTHILSEIEQIADTFGVIVDGTIIEEVSLGNIKKQYSDGLEDYFWNVMSGSRNND